MCKLIIVRHGETEYNSQNRYCGIIDPSLDDTGIANATKVAVSLGHYKIDKIYTSALKRAYETGKHIADQCDINHDSIEVNANLNETDFGIFEGLTYDEIMAKYSKQYSAWISDQFNVSPPKGESIIDLQKRSRSAFKRVVSENMGKTVVVVTHGGPIKLYLLELMQKEQDDFWSIEHARCAYSVIDHTDITKPEIEIYNNKDHLL